LRIKLKECQAIFDELLDSGVPDITINKNDWSVFNAKLGEPLTTLSDADAGIKNARGHLDPTNMKSTENECDMANKNAVEELAKCRRPV
jgi:hypothetical protein